MSVRMPALLALLFAAFGSLGSALFASQMPPFQNPDEPAHMLRADQISRGGLMGTRQGQAMSGGEVDAGLMAALARWMPIHAERDPNFRFTRQVLQEINGVRWQRAVVLAGFPNTAAYPPFLYAPAVLGLSLGRATRMSVGQSMISARLTSALAATLIGTAAVALAGSAAPWVFALLTLPMATAQIGAAAPDGLMLALAALAAGLLGAGIREGRAITGGRFTTAVVALALVVLARPAYAPLALVILALPGLSLMKRLAGLAGSVLPAVAWWIIASAIAMVELHHGPHVDSREQLAGLLQHPGRIPDIALGTWRLFGQLYANQFIGVFGWYEVNLPATYRGIAWGMLAIAAVLLLLAGPNESKAGPGVANRSLRWLLCLVALLGSVALVFLSLYLTWSEVGLGHVDGVQGRYFYPIAAFIPCLLLPLLQVPHQARLVGLGMLAVFPVASIIISVQRVVLRYYVG